MVENMNMYFYYMLYELKINTKMNKFAQNSDVSAFREFQFSKLIKNYMKLLIIISIKRSFSKSDRLREKLFEYNNSTMRSIGNLRSK